MGTDQTYYLEAALADQVGIIKNPWREITSSEDPDIVRDEMESLKNPASSDPVLVRVRSSGSAGPESLLWKGRFWYFDMPSDFFSKFSPSDMYLVNLPNNWCDQWSLNTKIKEMMDLVWAYADIKDRTRLVMNIIRKSEGPIRFKKTRKSAWKGGFKKSKETGDRESREAGDYPVWYPSGVRMPTLGAEAWKYANDWLNGDLSEWVVDDKPIDVIFEYRRKVDQIFRGPSPAFRDNNSSDDLLAYQIIDIPLASISGESRVPEALVTLLRRLRIYPESRSAIAKLIRESIPFSSIITKVAEAYETRKFLSTR